MFFVALHLKIAICKDYRRKGKTFLFIFEGYNAEDPLQGEYKEVWYPNE